MNNMLIIFCALLFFCDGPLFGRGSILEKLQSEEEFLSPDVASFDCHSSSLVENRGRNPLCGMERGSQREGKSNIDMKESVGIWAARFDGSVWSEPKEIVQRSALRMSESRPLQTPLRETLCLTTWALILAKRSIF